MKRSKGITILGWYLVITSFTGTISNLYMLFSPPAVMINLYASIFKPNPIFLNQISSITSLLLNVLSFFLGINILKLKEDWREITLNYFYFMIFYTFFFYLFTAKEPLALIPMSVGTVVIYGFLIYFLNNKNVKEQFTEQTDGRAGLST